MSSSTDRLQPGERSLPAEIVGLPDELKRLLGIVALLAGEYSHPREVVQRCLEAVCDFTGWPLGHAFLRAGAKACKQ